MVLSNKEVNEKKPNIIQNALDSMIAGLTVRLVQNDENVLTK